MYERDQTVMGPLRQFRIWFWAISVLSFIVIVVVSYAVYRLIHQPLKQLVRAFRKVEQGNLDLALAYRGNDEFRYLYSQFNTMVQNLQRMIHEIYEQKYRAKNAELKQLQSQINPHFLYNSLFILYRLAKKNGDDNQIKFTKYLSDYFQFITRNSSDEVLLSEEVQHARNYVDIQTIRFAHSIQVQFDELPSSPTAIKVPRLILQPIIENAYKYGLEYIESGGKLQVTFVREGQDLTITVEDNGERADDSLIAEMQRRLEEKDDSRETTGLVNVHRRLQFRFGAAYGLQVSKGSLSGFKVTMTLPVHEKSSVNRNHHQV